MALDSLRYRRGPSGLTETKHGSLIYDGNPAGYHEFEFRARLKIAAAKEDDKAQAMMKIVEGLRGDAFAMAQDIGMTELMKTDGLDKLVKAIRDQVFPLRQSETRELFLAGQKTNGPLSRAQGEPMASYITRRRRWWSMLRELDDTISLSSNIRGDLLLDQSGLSRTEKLLVLTSINNKHDFEEVAKALVEQHPHMGHEDDRRWKNFGTDGRGGNEEWTEYDEEGDEDWNAEAVDAWTRPRDEETEVTDDVEIERTELDVLSALHEEHDTQDPES
eukprot:6459758-Amphidinium_carterae.1